MKKDSLEKRLLQLKGSEGSYPFGPEALIFKVMGKMFALVSQTEAPTRITLKCAPVDGEILVSQYESVVPGYYMNKRHWITISLGPVNTNLKSALQPPPGELPDRMLINLVNGSYALVVGKLSKADKSKLEQQG